MPAIICVLLHTTAPWQGRQKNYTSDGNEYKHYILKHLKFKKLNVINSLSKGHQQADSTTVKPIHMKKADM
jgi:hypothetical protein